MRTKQEIATRFAPREQLDSIQSFFLVGIGGAGMSGVARMLRNRGFTVRGTDSTPSDLILDLIESGIEVKIGHSGESIQPGDALVLTDAIPLDASPEVARAMELGVPLFRRSQVLGWLLRDKKTIAVTGTHGKTTTTSMLALAMVAEGFDPTVVVGAEVPAWGTSIREGEGEYAVIEACEAYDSLHDFDPHTVVLTNLELDHVDFHETWENLRDSVTRFVNRAEHLVYNSADAGSIEIAGRVRCAGEGFDPTGAPVDESGAPLVLAQKGAHNRANALAALAGFSQAVGRHSTDAGRQAIAGFGGAERRQQVIFEGQIPGGTGEITILDDYAHHPTEVTVALQAIREGWIATRKRQRLVVVFQPHLYTRTAPLINEFAASLDEADFVVLTDIYPAREAPIPGVSSVRIGEKLRKPSRYVPARHLLPREVAAWIQPGDVIVGMGAGNISEFAPGLAAELKRRERPTPKVLVAYAGSSPEREVSIHSGRAIFAGLKELGYDAQLIDLSQLALSSGDLSVLIGPDRPDLVFLALHGPGDEDGTAQGLLEFFHIPYTGSGIQASAIAMDKEATKRVLAAAGVPVPQGIQVRRGDPVPNLPMPVVVKPNSQGSTVGLSFVHDAAELPAAIEKALAHDEACLVEEMLQGVEISVPVFDDRAMPPVEVVPKSGSYDFEMKYTPGATEEICPARLTPEQTQIAMDQAVRAHQALGCRGITRTDMIVTADRIVALETNTLPGMTPTSLVPRSAKEAGMSFNDVVKWIVEDALSQH